MNTIIYHDYDANLDFGIESIAFRTSYLLADMCVGVGKAGFDLFMMKSWQKLEYREKIMLLEGLCKEGEQKRALDLIKEVIKINKTLKHRSQQQIVAYNRAGQMLNLMCQEVVESHVATMQKTGIAELEHLKEDKVFGFFDVAPEQEKLKNGSAVKASELLQLKRDDEEQVDSLFFLPSEFYKENFKGTIASYKPTENNGDTDNFYLEHCFTLPNINILKADELKAVRKQLSGAGLAFRATTTEWMKLCFGKAPMQERADLFKNKLLQDAAAVQDAMAANELLQHCDNIFNKETQVHITMGEIPVNLLWDFYRHVGSIDDEAWEKLHEDGTPGWRSCPVMVVSHPVAETEITKPLEDYETMPVKKSIAID